MIHETLFRAQCVALIATLGASATLHADPIPYAAVAPTINGLTDDAAWQRAAWRDIKYLTLGTPPSASDFSGRYKLLWNEAGLYLLAEIVDDVLIDAHPDPLERYWDDDTLEIFVDADASGGDHLYNYSAFAYHVALDNQAVDVGPFQSEEEAGNEHRFVRTFPDHIASSWQRANRAPHTIMWEVHIKVFGDDFNDDANTQPLRLSAGRTLGFMVAYCDADDTQGRQHFVGDVDIEPVNGDRNRGYIDADVFRRVTLVR